MSKDKDFNIVNSDLDLNNLKIERKKLKSIIAFCLLTSIIITIVHNLKIDFYLKNIIIPFSLMLANFIYLIYKNKIKVNKKAYIFLIPISLILISDVIVNIDLSNKLLNVFILPILISIFLLLLVNKNYKINRGFLFWVFKLFPNKILSNLNHIKEVFNNLNKPKTKVIINVLIGLLIGFPIALIFLVLLANADKYFNEFISFIFSFIQNIFSNNLIFNIFITIISFIILFSVFINLLKNKNDKLKNITYSNPNSVVISTIFIIINSIFILFLISEISKLTSNFLKLPIEYTFAEYAREGFFQLLTVTCINFSIIIYNIYFTKILNKNSFIKKLILLLIGFSIVLVFNSYYRMFLYIQEYGFTILRLQVILFLAMELTLFIILIKKIIRDFKMNDILLFINIMVSFYLLNLYLCTSDFIKLISFK